MRQTLAACRAPGPRWARDSTGSIEMGDLVRVWWTDGGVHQNLTFPVQPDPISGMHCWHQRVTVEKARKGDEYGDVEVDTTKSMAVFREWLALARLGPRPGGLRRPLHFARAVKPSAEACKLV